MSASVKAYFALKLAGLAVDDEPMTRLRERILALGGIQAANSYVKINLSLFNLYPRDHVATVPPEIILLGNLLYQMSSWTRAIIMPLSIVQALDREGRPVPAGFTLEELFLPGEPLDFHRDRAFFLLAQSVLLQLDAGLKWWGAAWHTVGPRKSHPRSRKVDAGSLSSPMGSEPFIRP